MSQILDKPDIKEMFLAAFQEQEAELNGKSQAPLHVLRKQAMASFDKAGFPSLKNEEYRYTPITRGLSKNIGSLSNKTQPIFNKEAYLKATDDGIDANKLVFINGHFSKELSSITSPPEEMAVMDIKEASKNKPELLENYFARFASYENDAFTALNTAFSLDGTVVQIPANKVVQKPIAFYYITDTTAGATFYQPRNLIIIGKSSQVSFVENFIAMGNDFSFTNMVTEIVAAENAQVNYYKIQRDGHAAYHVGTTQVYQEKNSTFSAVTITLSGGLIRNNLNITIDGEGSEANMFGLYLLKDKQHVDNHTVVDHKKPNTQSNELYKGVLDGSSTGVFNGKIFVRAIAQKTNAFQSNRNILLTNDASMNTKPQLEIWADDVKCSHGATTGQINEEQLFYLRARGIDEDTAKAMLLYAFAIDVLENIKIPALKESLDIIIAERLTGGIS